MFPLGPSEAEDLDDRLEIQQAEDVEPPTSRRRAMTNFLNVIQAPWLGSKPADFPISVLSNATCSSPGATSPGSQTWRV